jgi:hypothetical protein
VSQKTRKAKPDEAQEAKDRMELKDLRSLVPKTDGVLKDAKSVLEKTKKRRKKYKWKNCCGDMYCFDENGNEVDNSYCE